MAEGCGALRVQDGAVDAARASLSRPAFCPGENYYEVREYRKGLFRELIREQGIPLKPGAVETLNWLRENQIFTAVVTANGYDRTKRYLEKLDIFDLFDDIICADMVEQGKPAPDIYAYACEKLNIRPDRALAMGTVSQDRDSSTSFLISPLLKKASISSPGS